MYPIKVMKASCRQAALQPPSESPSRPAGRLINPCGAEKKSRGHPIPRLIRAPTVGVGVGRKEQPVQRATLASGSALLHFLGQDRAWGAGVVHAASNTPERDWSLCQEPK